MNLKPLYQDDAWNTLRTMSADSQTAAEAKLPGSLILLGPQGVGKKRMARAFFQALHCTANSDFEPCGQCRNCTVIAAGNHVDLIELAAKESLIQVADLREALKANAYRPYEGRIRLFIIDEAHRLSLAAANALL